MQRTIANSKKKIGHAYRMQKLRKLRKASRRRFKASRMK
jgi:hypothetical protein